MKMISFVFAVFTLFSFSIGFASSPSSQVVRGIASDSMYASLGLKPGDKIVSYDGYPVTSVNDAMEFYNKLKNNTVKVVIFERDGKQETLVLSVN